MYTQCEHCKAIFQVNMREVTVAKGHLRCGECFKVFKATKSLSTTIPEKFEEKISEHVIKKDIKQEPNVTKSTAKVVNPVSSRGFEIDIRIDNQTSTPNINTKSTNKKISSKLQIDNTKEKRNKWLALFATTLFILLITQILYHFRSAIMHTPIREPDKIQMVTHNVFAHPNEPGVLLITATIENTADHSQPYPALELSLNNSQSTIIALRRFKPVEYLDNYTKDMLFPAKSTSTLKLKIKDPGNKATRFQFSFL